MDGADESGRRPGLRLLWVSGLMGFLLCNWVDGFEDLNVTEHQFMDGYGFSTPPLMVGLSLIAGAASTGAVCLDGTLPGYHLHRGYGSGANSWLIHLEVYSRFWISTPECSEVGSFGYLAGTQDSTLLLYQAGASTDVGGGWCNTIRTCVFRKKTPHGSSTHMEKLIPFTGILSNRAEENPDFYNWNRVKLRYCDGASFSGDSQNEAKTLYFRGQRIWLAAMKDLMSKGMHYANQALLSGCSAGGLAAILHCDEFRELFPRTTRVKCLSDAGLFLDVIDVSGGRTLRHMFGGVVRLQQVGKMLPQACTSRLNPILCFFPQHLIPLTKTPLFLLNAAYDSWQILASLAPHSADPRGYWQKCRLNYAYCSSSQIQFLQDFRKQMLNAVGGFSGSKRNGLFINSCFAHCQTERQDTWFAHNSPRIGNKGIAQSVGDWYFDRAEVKVIDCPYPCDKTCHNLVFRQSF